MKELRRVPRRMPSPDVAGHTEPMSMSAVHGPTGVLRAVFDRIRSRFNGDMPPLDGATTWLNSAPLSRADLRGKVVLVQFWSYTCIDWLGTLPYVSAWSENYAARGLVVIGVHTPEHSFEHDIENVMRAPTGLGIRYPIAIDNHSTIWEAFKRPYSPSLFVVDAALHVREHLSGSEGYQQLDQLIRQLVDDLGEKERSRG